ncbi:TRZ/ATZ family hydrolase [Umboniibacter marinipuniceus]|uniref:5-methylthioadenosine/S-adenosylhomocysteine deaminase n=1 Tax=Umboniibacter marinipuniceus TaxID=569599 RepID=A0A3M0A6E7_9GAMM|nr:TRZ/ATZ family hydrolase [Umboniibacter marinipuniceus]RMA79974.1 5-methylthioadenosine/S-adenosylhomocysteine deaminase [Umboniibacter marinipuniceus]
MSVQFVDTILHCKYLLAIKPMTIQNECAIVIDEGQIVDLVASHEIPFSYRAADELFFDNHLLMPGLINTHGHAAMSLLRGFADDLALQTWLNDHIWPAETKFVSAAFVELGTELAMAEMLMTGTTCFSDMYFFPDAAAEAVDRVGMRAQIAATIFDFPCNWGSGPDDYLSKARSMAEDLKQHELINFAIAPHAPYTVNDTNFAKAKAFADEFDIPLQVHLHETQQEVDDAVASSGTRPLNRLIDNQFIDAKSQLVHMTALTAADIEAVAKLGASVITCPRSNLKLASGMCPTQALLDNGVNVAIGTDGAASNNALDMFSELQYTALTAKIKHGNPEAISATSALEMATINGAKALGVQDICGTLERGKSADMIAIDMSGIDLQPCFNLIAELVYSQIGHRVTDVWVAGRRLVQDQQLTTIDNKHLRSRVQAFTEQALTKTAKD